MLITIYWLGRRAQCDQSYDGPYLNFKAFEGLLGTALYKVIHFKWVIISLGTVSSLICAALKQVSYFHMQTWNTINEIFFYSHCMCMFVSSMEFRLFAQDFESLWGFKSLSGKTMLRYKWSNPTTGQFWMCSQHSTQFTWGISPSFLDGGCFLHISRAPCWPWHFPLTQIYAPWWCVQDLCNSRGYQDFQ